MDLELKAGSRSHAVAVWQRIRAQFVRLPATARVMLGLFLLAALLMAMHTAHWGQDASLRLKVQHNLRGGQISVWVDGELVSRLFRYTHRDENFVLVVPRKMIPYGSVKVGDSRNTSAHK
jgi:hypothetical protein